MTTATTTTVETPRIYVGTYHKYNCGSIAGAWLDLDDYTDLSEFYDAAKALHKDESDPELMFQDWENCPDGLVGESWISPIMYDDYIPADESEQEIYLAYSNGISERDTLETVLEQYKGQGSSKADFAQTWVEETDGKEFPYWIAIDWERTYDNLEFSGIWYESTLFVFGQ